MDLCVWPGSLIDEAYEVGSSFSTSRDRIVIVDIASQQTLKQDEDPGRKRCLYLDNGCVYEATFSGKLENEMEEHQRTVTENGEDVHAHGPLKLVYTPLAKHSVVSLQSAYGVFGVVTSSNQAYVWGRSEKGQCGVIDQHIDRPQRVRFMKAEVVCDHGAKETGREMPVVSLAFSRTMCLAICVDSSLWSWGALSDNEPAQVLPTAVDALCGRRVMSVACGEQHHLAVVATEKNLRSSLSSNEFSLTNFVDSCVKCQEARAIRRRVAEGEEEAPWEANTNLSTEVNADDGSFFCPLGLRLELSLGSSPMEDHMQDSSSNFGFDYSSASHLKVNKMEPKLRAPCSASVAGDIGVSRCSLSRQRCRERGDIEMTEMRKAKSVGTRFSFTSVEFAGVSLPSSIESSSSDRSYSAADAAAVTNGDDISLSSLQPTHLFRAKLGRQKHDGRNSRMPKVHVPAEIWSWGDNSCGQLGLGSFINRKEPTRIDKLNDVFVTHIKAGAYHSLALSATGDLWTWGSNSFGQIKQVNIDAQPNPVVMKVGSQSCVLDATAGPDYTALLVNTLDYRTDLYYCGRDYKATNDKNTAASGVAVRLAAANKNLWSISLNTSNEMIISGARDSQKSPGLQRILQLVCSEIKYAHRLKQLHTFAGELPRQHLLGDTEGGRLFQAYADTLRLLFTAILQRLASLKSELCERDDPLAPTVFFDVLLSDSFASMLKGLHSIYCQMTAFNVFNEIDFSDSLEKSLLELSVTNEVESSKSYRLLRKLFHVPFSRLDEYCKLAQAIIQNQVASDGYDRLVHFVKDVKVLEQLLLNHYHLAESTCHFWSKCTGKNNLLPLRLANRLLVKEFTKMNGIMSVLENGTSVNWQHLLLFSDSIAIVLKHGNKTLELPLVWAVPLEHDFNYCIQLMAPEAVWTIEVVDGVTKNDLVHCCNQAIMRHQNGHYTEWTPGSAPPVRRYAQYHFSMKHSLYGDAVYVGSWILGKPHGRGEMTWSNGQFFRGKFRNGFMNGLGELRVPEPHGACTVTKGHWKCGQLAGLAIVEHGNGSRYEGYLKNGLRCGHGVLKQRNWLYVGAWNNDLRNGYGILDKGKEKYLGMWEMDMECGLGALVTLEGDYCEGTFDRGVFVKGKMTSSDATKYEGEFSGLGVLNGKGTIYFSNGDTVTGILHGPVSNQVKITNGMYNKCEANVVTPTAHTWLDSSSTADDQPALPAEQKWTDIFGHVYDNLGIDPRCEPASSSKCWENVVATLERLKAFFDQGNGSIDAVLEKVPNWNQPSDESYLQMVSEYCSKAFSVPYHPFGRLLCGLTDVFNACYSGVGAHPELLSHAVSEAFSSIRRIYELVRYLFPSLPPCSQMDSLIAEKSPTRDKLGCYETYGSLFYDAFLQLTYPNLFTLYVLRNDYLDRVYWDKISALNLKNDVALLDCLGVCRALWPIELKNTEVLDAPLVCATARKKYYADAIYCLQRLSSEFYPSAKLRVIVETFDNISKCVSSLASESENQHTWTADSLVPVTTYVIVRAQIQRLGAEIQLTENFSPQLTSLGEVQYMFTMLQGCYQHIIQNRNFG